MMNTTPLENDVAAEVEAIYHSIASSMDRLRELANQGVPVGAIINSSQKNADFLENFLGDAS